MLSNSLLMLQALCVVYGAPAGGRVTAVVANRAGDGVELVVKGQQLAEPKVYTRTNGKLRVFEFQASLDGTPTRSNVGFGGINAYASTIDKDKVKISVELTTPMEPSLRETETGWALSFQQKQVAQTKKPMVTIKAPAPVQNVADAGTVTVDFVNADIVQVLKAIAMQANVNIITSPDVKGTLTVSLKSVSVDEALKMVTGLAGLAYDQYNGTFIVAPVDKIGPIANQIKGITPPVSTVKVEPDVTQVYHVQGSTAADLLAALRDQATISQNTINQSGSTVGNNAALNPANPNGVTVPINTQQGLAGQSTTTTQPVSQDAFASLLRGRVTARSTPKDSVSDQVIVLKGPAKDVESVMEILRELDSTDRNLNVEILEIKYADPRALRDELVASITGLRASYVPNSVANPYAYSEGRAIDQASLNGPEAARAKADKTGGNQITESGNQSSAASASEGASPLASTFTALRATTTPMKLILRGSPAAIAAARSYAAVLDVAPKQIAVEVRVASITREEAKRVGIDWSILDGGGILTGLKLAGNVVDKNVDATFRGGHTVTAQLDDLLNNDHLIARPNLLVVDGMESEAFVGDIVNYIKSIQTDDQGRQQVEIASERVGVRIPILARAGADGNISLSLEPSTSVITGFLDVPGGGSVPQIGVRSSHSSAVIKSGETIAIGGLIKEEDVNNVKGIPLLKDLPFIGALFRRTEKSKTRNEVVFFLTAKIVDNSTIGTAAMPEGTSIQK